MSSVKEAAIFTAIDLVLAAVALFFFGIGILDALGLILLLEGAALMIVGGALGFSGQAGVRRVITILGLVDRVPRNERNPPQMSEKEKTNLGDVRAAFYMVTGLLLFFESMILAFLIVA